MQGLFQISIYMDLVADYTYDYTDTKRLVVPIVFFSHLQL